MLLRSRDARQHFPLMAVSLNFSLLAMQAVRREGKAERFGLEKAAAADRAALLLFGGLWHAMRAHWAGHPDCSISHFPPLLHSLQVQANKAPKAIVEAFLADKA
jgi:hypothetical protein